jgi:hypothetical protein
MNPADNHFDEKTREQVAHLTEVTVEAADTFLRLTVDPNTGRVELRDLLTVEGTPRPFVLSPDGKVVFVGIPKEGDGSFRVTLSTKPETPSQSDETS